LAGFRGWVFFCAYPTSLYHHSYLPYYTLVTYYLNLAKFDLDGLFKQFESIWIGS